MNSKITGIILAGGESKRMGVDKSSVLYHGKPLLEYPINLLKLFCDEILISAETNKYSEYDYRRVPDITKNNGPLSGIYSCLKASKNEINIVVSCDMPLLSESLLEHMIKNSEGYDLAMPYHRNHFEPLCAVYTKSLIPIMESLFNVGDYGPLSLIPIVNFKKLMLNESFEFYSHNLFRNINTFEDLNNI